MYRTVIFRFQFPIPSGLQNGISRRRFFSAFAKWGFSSKSVNRWLSLLRRRKSIMFEKQSGYLLNENITSTQGTLSSFDLRVGTGIDWGRKQYFVERSSRIGSLFTSGAMSDVLGEYAIWFMEFAKCENKLHCASGWGCSRPPPLEKSRSRAWSIRVVVDRMSGISSRWAWLLWVKICSLDSAGKIVS